jgi:hypothetical protein
MEPNPDENPLMVDLLWADPKGSLAEMRCLGKDDVFKVLKTEEKKTRLLKV